MRARGMLRPSVGTALCYSLEGLALGCSQTSGLGLLRRWRSQPRGGAQISRVAETGLEVQCPSRVKTRVRDLQPERNENQGQEPIAKEG